MWSPKHSFMDLNSRYDIRHNLKDWFIKRGGVCSWVGIFEIWWGHDATSTSFPSFSHTLDLDPKVSTTKPNTCKSCTTSTSWVKMCTTGTNDISVGSRLPTNVAFNPYPNDVFFGALASSSPCGNENIWIRQFKEKQKSPQHLIDQFYVFLPWCRLLGSKCFGSRLIRWLDFRVSLVLDPSGKLSPLFRGTLDGGPRGRVQQSGAILLVER